MASELLSEPTLYDREAAAKALAKEIWGMGVADWNEGDRDTSSVFNDEVRKIADSVLEAAGIVEAKHGE